MTMSVMANEGRGGFRPTAPQNNPMNVSATGGAGQAAMYAAGIEDAQSFYDTQTSAPISGKTPGTRNPTFEATKKAVKQNSSRAGLLGTTPFDAPTEYPDIPVTDGAALGPGRGPEALMTASPQQLSNEDNARLVPLLPLLGRIAEKPGTSNGFKNWYRSVRSSVKPQNNQVV